MTPTLRITAQNDPFFGGLCFMVHTRSRPGVWLAVSFGWEKIGSRPGDWSRRIRTSSLMEAVEVVERLKHVGGFNTVLNW